MLKFKLRYLLILIAITIIVVFASSCRKYKENRIEGTWDFVSLADHDKYLDVSWTFYEDKTFIIKTINNNTLTTTYDTGTYKITVQSFKTYLDIFDVNLWDSGKYFVDKVSGKYLTILQQNDGFGSNIYVRKEFTKSK